MSSPRSPRTSPAKAAAKPTKSTRAPQKKAPVRKAPTKRAAINKATPKPSPARKAPAKRATGRARTAKKILGPSVDELEAGASLPDEVIVLEFRRRFPLALSVKEFTDDRRSTLAADWSKHLEALADLAIRLAVELDCGAGLASAAVSKELRATLTDLAPKEAGDDELEDHLDGLGVPV